MTAALKTPRATAAAVTRLEVGFVSRGNLVAHGSVMNTCLQEGRGDLEDLEEIVC